MFKPNKLMMAVSLASAGAFAQEETPVLEEVLVTGVKSSIESALARKRNADTFIDSIVAEDIGKFPDQNIAESLQRITGVSIARDNGEGGQVTVRGFGPEFNIVKLNGRTIATALPGRQFDFQVLSSDLVAGVDVIKTPEAKTPEGSVGAMVDMRTARPLDKPGFSASIQASARHNDLQDETDPQGSLTISNTFADDTIGFTLGVSAQESSNRIDQVGGTRSSLFDASGQDDLTDVNGNPVPGQLVRHPGRWELNLIREERERLGAVSAVQWQASDNLLFTLDGFYTDFEQKEDRRGMQLPILVGDFTDITVTENGTMARFTAGANIPQRLDMLQVQAGSDSTTYAFSFNTAFEDERQSIDIDIHYSKSDALLSRSDFVPQIGSNDGVDDLGQFTLDLLQNDAGDIQSSIDPSDPTAIRAHWNQVTEDDIEDELYEARFSQRWKNLEWAYLEAVEYGTFYTKREKSLRHSEISPEIFCLNTCGSGTPLDPSLFGVTPSNFLSEEEGNFPRQFVFIDDLEGYFNAIGELNGVPNWQEPEFVPRASNITEEETLGAYFQFDLQGDLWSIPWSGNFGVRAINTTTESSGVSQSVLSVERQFPDNPLDTALFTEFSEEQAVTETNDYWNILPSLNLAFDLREDIILRMAASRVITRPTISDMTVSQSFDISNLQQFAVETGNPSLEPFEVNQFDLGIEYFGNNTSASAAFYYKDIDTFISESTRLEDTGFDISSNFGPDVDLFQAVTQPRNRPGGRVSGIELAVTHFFEYLPSIFSGLGVQANYTYADSEDDNAPEVDLPLVKSPGSSVEGFADNIFNVILLYDNEGPLEARLAFNWRDEFLAAREGQRSFGLPEHVDSFGQLDFSSSYDITDNITATIEAINLTNERVFRFEDVKERVSLIQYSGTRYMLGVRASF